MTKDRDKEIEQRRAILQRIESCKTFLPPILPFPESLAEPPKDIYLAENRCMNDLAFHALSIVVFAHENNLSDDEKSKIGIFFRALCRHVLEIIQRRIRRAKYDDIQFKANLLNKYHDWEEELKNVFERYLFAQDQGIGKEVFGKLSNKQKHLQSLCELISQKTSPKKARAEHENKSDRKTTKKKGRKVKKSEQKYKPWTNPGDARLVVDKQRVKFYHDDDEIEDLKLKNESPPHKLLFFLTSGSMRPKEIKEAISPDSQVTAGKIVDRANEALNKKIREVGFTCLPDHDVAFIIKDGFGCYVPAVPIESKEDFESWQRDRNCQKGSGTVMP